MAKKKDDEIEDNNDFNDDNQNDFNEADDSFGLPDVDYQPLDETAEEDTSSSSDDSTSSYSDDSSSTYSDDTDSSDDTESDSYSSDYQDTYAQENEQESTNEYVPGSYTPPQEESSNTGKIVAIVLILAVLGVGGWYFFIHKPAQEKEQARIEKLKQEEAAKRLAAEKKAEEERLAQEAADREAARLAAEEAAKPKIGTVETITARTGRYYVVIASDIDGDLAMDFANKLTKTGVSIQIIPPYGTSKFHRITVDNLDTWAAAENRANELKNEYGEDVWVIKY
ncbi:MAG: hypothetical protein RLO12_03675 [Fulvivirga sp.]|uniref:hypothetical protein n=1 Tax=Fulvivirga sp. TaxID=1931237 RepID=UPI0032EF9738